MNRLMKIICGRQRCEEELDIFSEERELVVQDIDIKEVGIWGILVSNSCICIFFYKIFYIY